MILDNKEGLVDWNLCYDNKRPVGLFDVVSLPKEKKFFRVLINKKNKLITLPIDEKEASVKPSKIISKTIIKKGKVQLNTSDGRSILVDDVKKYGIGDSILLNLPDQKIIEHLPLQANATIFLTGGSNVGVVGTVDTVDGNIVTIKSGDSVFKTKKSYALVVGKDKPIIALR